MERFEGARFLQKIEKSDVTSLARLLALCKKAMGTDHQDIEYSTCRLSCHYNRSAIKFRMVKFVAAVAALLVASTSAFAPAGVHLVTRYGFIHVHLCFRS